MAYDEFSGVKFGTDSGGGKGAGNTQLGRMLSRPDPLMGFSWRPKAVPFGESFGVTPDYIETFEVPFNNVKTEGVFMGGGFNYFPGFHDVSAFNITFYADAEGRTIKYLNAWKGKVKDFETGIYSLPGAYKRNWNVVLLNPQGSAVIEIQLEGCWPADTSQLSLVSEGSERLTFQQNFSIDNCKIL